MLQHQLGIKSIRMVVIQLYTLLIRNLVMAFIIRVMADDGNLLIKFLLDAANHRTLAASRSSRDSDQNHFRPAALARILLLLLIHCAHSFRIDSDFSLNSIMEKAPTLRRRTLANGHICPIL